MVRSSRRRTDDACPTLHSVRSQSSDRPGCTPLSEVRVTLQRVEAVPACPIPLRSGRARLRLFDDAPLKERSEDWRHSRQKRRQHPCVGTRSRPQAGGLARATRVVFRGGLRRPGLRGVGSRSMEERLLQSIGRGPSRDRNTSPSIERCSRTAAALSTKPVRSVNQSMPKLSFSVPLDDLGLQPHFAAPSAEIDDRAGHVGVAALVKGNRVALSETE